MMRNPGRAATLIAVALAVTACGAGSGSPGGGAYGSPAYGTQATPATQATQATTAGASVRTAALKTEAIGAGKVLASGGGLTLYYYTKDKPGSGTSMCTGSCAAAWPPLAAPVKAPAGVRLPGPLGMITRPGGGPQVTINGYPIYTFSGDKSPGQDAGNGIGGAWYIIKIHATAAARAAVLKTETTRAGKVLASSRGLTLYYYTKDKQGSGTSTCTGSCAAAWPPLTASVRAPAGVRMPGPLSYITRPGGVRQLTINGYPIYTYAGDKAPGQATGNGIAGAWHIIKIR